MIGQQDPIELFRTAGLRFADYYRAVAEENKESARELAKELENLFSALTIYQQANAWSQAALLIHALDVFLDSQGYWDVLHYWLESVLEHAGKLSNPNVLTANTLSLAHLVSIQGERKKSIDIYYRAIDLGEKNNDLANLSQAYYGLGTVFLSTGELEQAREHWQKALQYANESSDGIQIAIIKYNLTILDKNEEEHEPSISKLEKATDFATRIFSRLGQEGIPLSGMFRASTLLQHGKYKEAQKLFLEILGQFDKGNEKQGEALVLYNLGLIAQNQNDPNTALDYFRRSLEIASSLKDQTGLILLNSSIGMTHLQMGRYDLARPYLEEHNRLLREDADQERLADNLYWLGYALANTGDLQLAEKAFEESRSIFSKIGSKRVDGIDEVLLKVRALIHNQTN